MVARQPVALIEWVQIPPATLSENYKNPYSLKTIWQLKLVSVGTTEDFNSFASNKLQRGKRSNPNSSVLATPSTLFEIK